MGDVGSQNTHGVKDNKMTSRFRRDIGTTANLRFAKPMMAFIIGGMAVHVTVMLLDYFLMIEPVFLDLRTNFVGSVFH
jgi:hypothetical protein